MDAYALWVAFAAAMPAIVAGIIWTVANGSWEWALARRTRRDVNGLKIEVRENVAEAKADRDNILAQVATKNASLSKQVSEEVARVLVAIETQTADRIAKANAAIVEQRAEMEQALATAEETLQKREAAIEQHIAEALRSEEMRRRGQVGNAAQEAMRVTGESAGPVSDFGEAVAMLEAKFGSEVVANLRERFPHAWTQAEQDPPNWMKYLRYGLAAINGGGGIPGLVKKSHGLQSRGAMDSPP